MTRYTRRNEERPERVAAALRQLQADTAEAFAIVDAAFSVLGALATLGYGDLISQSTSSAAVSFKVGEQILLEVAAGTARNATIVPCLHTGSTGRFVDSGHASAGAQLDGTWRARGYDGGTAQLAVRVA